MRSISVNAPAVRFGIYVANLKNGGEVQTESVLLFTKDFMEVHELIKRFHAFIFPIQDALHQGKPICEVGDGT